MIYIDYIYHKMSTTICKLNSIPPNPPRTWSRFVPPFNFNTIHSESDLSERRKYEILQYKQNQYQETSKQKLVNILKGTSKCNKPSWTIQKPGVVTNPNVLNLPRIGNTLIYNRTINQSKCMSSKRSNIPGKEILLCKKNNIPITMLYTKRNYR
jgi:hypothetical protein